MPSKNTSVISARVKDETAVKLGELAELRGITIAKLIDDMVADYEHKGMEKGVTPDEKGVSAIFNEDFEENLRYKELRLDKLVTTFEEYGYPDWFVRQQIETLISQIRDSGKYNPRRSNSDCGC